MLATCASIAVAIDSSSLFFSSVKSSATRGAASRACSSFSRVERDGLTLVAMSAARLPGRKIGADLLRERPLNRVRMAAVDNRHMHARFARRFGCTQLRAHASGAKLAL